jgi:arginine decarboxylase
VRVYATQSTHKTLTSLRQGSMIHVNDQDFKGQVEQSFHEAYMTHTSTSPNYQIIASLDVGRRQVELEGFEFVQRQVEAAMSMRRAISTHPLLQKYFKVLTAGDMIPAEFRESGVESYYDPSRAGPTSGNAGRRTSSSSTRPASRWPSAAPAGTATRSRPRS